MEAPPVLEQYVQAMIQHSPGRGTTRLKRLLHLKHSYPQEPFLEAITQALTYGLYDLSRLETLIIQQVRGTFFRLEEDD